MRLGIDFGTTHTVVALVDRGNYPIVAFEGESFVPSLVASRMSDGALAFGSEAAAVRHDSGWSVLRSFKRLLSEAGPAATVAIGGRPHRLQDLLAGFFSQLHRDLVMKSNAGLAADETLEAAVSVPANASTAQRFLTLEGFKRGGFCVEALLNEPSAAGFEYAHRHRSSLSARREYVVVYDLGGGTFDASLLKMAYKTNEVVTSSGVQRLGGDDFDEAILELVLEKAACPPPSPLQRELLLEECARQKEAVTSATRRVLFDLAAVGREPLVLPVDEVYAACAPLVERTLDAIEPLLSRASPEEEDGISWSEIAGLYVVGGAGSFPPISRRLKERFGERRVKRSPHSFAATAIGLAISLDREAGYALAERLTRHFGVFRETSSGTDVVFDPIFEKDTPLPTPGEPPLLAVRRYRAAHNIGHFRFLECSRIEEGRPDGDVTPWEEVRFPFDPRLRSRADLEPVAVVRDGQGPEVEELYACGAEGAIRVKVTVLADGFSRTFTLSR